MLKIESFSIQLVDEDMFGYEITNINCTDKKDLDSLIGILEKQFPPNRTAPIVVDRNDTSVQISAMRLATQNK